jgi:serine/threonine-protein phosphatase 2A regulatory subunit B'
MSSGTFVDRIDPFAKRSLKKKSRKSQGSSRYRNSQDVELQQLPPLKGKYSALIPSLPSCFYSSVLTEYLIVHE